MQKLPKMNPQNLEAAVADNIIIKKNDKKKGIALNLSTAGTD